MTISTVSWSKHLVRIQVLLSIFLTLWSSKNQRASDCAAPHSHAAVRYIIIDVMLWEIVRLGDKSPDSLVIRSLSFVRFISNSAIQGSPDKSYICSLGITPLYSSILSVSLLHSQSSYTSSFANDSRVRLATYSTPGIGL